MKNILKLTIITPEKEFYSGEVSDLVTENQYGRLGFLPEHIAMVTVLKPSVTTFTEKDGKKLRAFTSSGILSINDDEINLMCDASEWPEDIDINRAEEARKRAEMRLKENTGVNMDRSEVALMRALMRIKARSI
ncbi:MAG: F0F1 ATP synthase subunit epsilon [Clostridiaceae bacterium]|nr:F0F1 ATP synthase subunit epsilon [Clostridiaceae bacterium]